MTKEDQQDQTIEDFFIILSEVVKQFHKIFVTPKPRDLNEFATEDQIKIFKELGDGEMYKILNSLVSNRNSDYKGNLEVSSFNRSKVLQMREKWREHFIKAVSEDPTRKDELKYINSEDAIISPIYDTYDFRILQIESIFIQDVIEKRLLLFTNPDQRNHYMRLYVDEPLVSIHQLIKKNYPTTMVEIVLTAKKDFPSSVTLLFAYSIILSIASETLKVSRKIREGYNLAIPNTVENETTTKRQILMLRYLGALDTNFGLASQRKIADVLGTVLNRNSQTVREGLINDMRDAKTIENLEFVLSEFEKYKLPKEMILADLAKLRNEN